MGLFFFFFFFFLGGGGAQQSTPSEKKSNWPSLPCTYTYCKIQSYEFMQKWQSLLEFS